MQDASKLYFKKLFHNQDFKTEISGKKNGCQLGFKLKLVFIDNSLNFHIKTHQYGSSSSQTCHKKCDIKELFIYKVLNKTEILPEVHFFHYLIDEVVQFCIASLDVINNSNKISKNNNLNIPIKNDYFDKNNIYENQDLEYYLTFVDILSRIFLLSDCLTNDGNFGFIMNGSSLKLYIYDFKIDTNYYGYKTHLIFEQFCLGNFRYNYTGFCEKILKDRDLKLRIKDAKHVMENLKNSNFFDILKECYDEIYKYFNDSDLLIKYKFEYHFDLTAFSYDSNQNIYDDFNVYVMSVKENFSQFSSKLDNFQLKE